MLVFCNDREVNFGTGKSVGGYGGLGHTPYANKDAEKDEYQGDGGVREPTRARFHHSMPRALWRGGCLSGG